MWVSPQKKTRREAKESKTGQLPCSRTLHFELQGLSSMSGLGVSQAEEWDTEGSLKVKPPVGILFFSDRWRILEIALPWLYLLGSLQHPQPLLCTPYFHQVEESRTKPEGVDPAPEPWQGVWISQAAVKSQPKGP